MSKYRATYPRTFHEGDRDHRELKGFHGFPKNKGRKKGFESFDGD